MVSPVSGVEVSFGRKNGVLLGVKVIDGVSVMVGRGVLLGVRVRVGVWVIDGVSVMVGVAVLVGVRVRVEVGGNVGKGVRVAGVRGFGVDEGDTEGVDENAA